MQWAKNYLLEYQAANVPPLVLVGNWIPPLCPLYKLNVNGARFSSQKEAGVGVIIWDNKGLVIAALSKNIDAPLGPFEIEAKAFEVGLQFAKDVGIYVLILEGDCLVMYRALAGISPCLASIAAIVYGIEAASQNFRNVSFSHVCRQGNISAQFLAKHAISIVDFSVWKEEIGNCFFILFFIFKNNFLFLKLKNLFGNPK